MIRGKNKTAQVLKNKPYRLFHHKESDQFFLVQRFKKAKDKSGNPVNIPIDPIDVTSAVQVHISGLKNYVFRLENAFIELIKENLTLKNEEITDEKIEETLNRIDQQSNGDNGTRMSIFVQRAPQPAENPQSMTEKMIEAEMEFDVSAGGPFFEKK